MSKKKTKTSTGETPAPTPAIEPVTRETSEAERKRIAAEYGRQGAKKSAEVRRANKAAREKAAAEAAPAA